MPQDRRLYGRDLRHLLSAQDGSTHNMNQRFQNMQLRRILSIRFSKEI